MPSWLNLNYNNFIPFTEQIVLSVGQRQFVVVHNGSHAGELYFAAFCDIVVLEVGLQEQSVLTDNFAKSSQKDLKLVLSTYQGDIW